MTTSSNYITFLERGLPVQAFTAERNSGIGFHNQFFDKRMTFHAGAFRDVDDDGEEFNNQGDYSAGVRATMLPVWDDEGETLVHTGVWYSRRFGDEPVAYAPNAESNTVGPLTQLGIIPSDGIDVLGAELAFVHGPFSAQGEFIVSFVEGGRPPALIGPPSPRTRDQEFYGSYITASVFLTGEQRNYDQNLGIFGRTSPKNSFSLGEGTWGAFELAGRWSYLTLNDNVRGGILNNFTFGLNWYLYSNLRLMTNYVIANRNGIGEAHIVQSRVSVDF